jgi:hypothetical protein
MSRGPEGEFIGRVQLATAFHDWSPSEAEACPGDRPSGVVLVEVEEWHRPVPFDVVVRRIDPTASNPHVQANAGGFQEASFRSPPGNAQPRWLSAANRGRPSRTLAEPSPLPPEQRPRRPRPLAFWIEPTCQGARSDSSRARCRPRSEQAPRPCDRAPGGSPRVGSRDTTPTDVTLAGYHGKLGRLAGSRGQRVLRATRTRRRGGVSVGKLETIELGWGGQPPIPSSISRNRSGGRWAAARVAIRASTRTTNGIAVEFTTLRPGRRFAQPRTASADRSGRGRR